ncbi:hypothetical protein IQ37_17725 [Chryseobacterium piperi]|uniref:Uncharacterized protein n=1 Tax=Chryseobacterium piperi TaxID=558152 RepID=A0A086AJ32_9FLAO|nr:hypothetical protein [Chryseobacterium piperi]ASW73870.1 hypothetical protein CJF12_05865 [Chryseobacterium piperi]KFF16696.1 hypothetical protein IQ37_17725 [Chryseobacterium piperi]
MKTHFTVLIISFFSLFCYGQTKPANYEATINTSLATFIETLKAKKVDQAVGLIYPKYVNKVSRQQMFTVLNLVYNNPSLVLNIQNYKINKISTPELIDHEYFSITDYMLTMKFSIAWNTIHSNEETRSMVKEQLVNTYGRENVMYVKNGDYYAIKSPMKAVMISKDGNDWSIIPLENADQSQLKEVLPAAILEKI